MQTNLKQKPPFEMERNRSGFNVGVLVKVWVISGLFFAVGFRYWQLTITDGDWKNNSAYGNSVTSYLNDLDSDPFGAALGFYCWF